MRRLAVVLSASGMFGACVAGPPGPPGPTGPAGPAAEVFAFTCPPDSVRSGTSCIDTYEASVWYTTDAAVIAKIKDGTVTLADLTAAGAKQFGFVPDDYGPGCPDTAAGCKDYFAVSIAGVLPSGHRARAPQRRGRQTAIRRTGVGWESMWLCTPAPGLRASPTSELSTRSGTSTSGWRSGCRAPQASA